MNLNLRMEIFALVFMFFIIGSATATGSYNCSADNSTCEPFCYTDTDCTSGYFCDRCPTLDVDLKLHTCRRNRAYMPTSIIGGLPFNHYTWLVTYISFASVSAPLFPNLTTDAVYYTQEDNVTNQLANGVRGLILPMYYINYTNSPQIWLCDSEPWKCYSTNAFAPAIETLREVETFLSRNPTEIVTIFIDDYVPIKNGLSKLFKRAGLEKYRFPLSEMPKNGEDWPLVSEMVRKNHRLLVFSSLQSKEATDGIAYKWSYIQDTKPAVTGSCSKSDNSTELGSKKSSLLMINFFEGQPTMRDACYEHANVQYMANLCIEKAGNMLPTYLATDFYMRGGDPGIIDSIDYLNALKLCGCDTISECKAGHVCKRKSIASSLYQPNTSAVYFVMLLLFQTFVFSMFN